MNIEYWLTFASAALLISITPGPDLLFILSKSGRSDRRTVFWGAAGLWAAALTHVLCVAIGLSALILTSQTMFNIIKYAGAIYLIWLGIKLFLHSDEGISKSKHANEQRLKSFSSGFFVSISNPKAALFFIAFLPMFVNGNDPEPQMHLFVLGVVVVAVKALVESIIILFSAFISRRLSTAPFSSKVMSKISSIFFVGFGLQLLFLRRPN